MEITGGADPATAAAIAVVIQRVLEDEAEAAARPEARPLLPAWTWAARVESHWRGPGSPDAPPPNRVV